MSGYARFQPSNAGMFGMPGYERIQPLEGLERCVHGMLHQRVRRGTRAADALQERRAGYMQLKTWSISPDQGFHQF